MKKLFSILIIVCLCGIFNFAQASIIRYNIIGGTDTKGYNFSGFVDIDSTTTYWSNGTFRGYDIDTFFFITPAGVNYGDSGELFFKSTPTQIYTRSATAHFYNDYIINFVGKDNLSTWSNAATGVWFVGVDPTPEAYSVLPEQIAICTSFMAGYGALSGFWGPAGSAGGNLILERAPSPIPEPATMLLLGVGLIGLTGFGRKKFN